MEQPTGESANFERPKKQTAEDKENAAINKIIISAEKDGEKLYILNRVVSYECKRDGLSSLANRILAVHPDVALLLIYSTEKHIEFLFALSVNHPKMGEQYTYITNSIMAKIGTSNIIARSDANQNLEFWEHGIYFSRDVRDDEYGGKITDEINSMIFTFLKTEKYLPEEEDVEDEFLF